MSDTPRTDALLARMDEKKYDDRTGSMALIAHAHGLEQELAEATSRISDGAKERERMRVALERAIGLLTLGALTEAGYDQRQEWQALTGMGVPK